MQQADKNKTNSEFVTKSACPLTFRLVLCHPFARFPWLQPNSVVRFELSSLANCESTTYIARKAKCFLRS
ncbi:unnamed protein product [Onchocerca flexuosa]|uniref:Uncharacterized protein n=1 Tax=Onchocerca flexuosa TaxID=387005 RepID=A0A183H868_9BILA|nr:unnamed protein product [Onchocerca flexuosa]